MIIQDVEWKEHNPQFGSHEIYNENNDSNSAFHDMEFEFDNVPKITLRGHKSISHSTGLALWTCCQILSAYLNDNRHLVEKKRVLELGSGMGLCGILCYHLGASEVLASDGDVDVLNNLRYNINRNCVQLQDHHAKENGGSKVLDSESSSGSSSSTSTSTGSDSAGGNISSTQLIWGRDLEAFKSTHKRHPVIVATDVFYAPQSIEPLWHTVDELLEPGGTFFLSFFPHKVSIAAVLEEAEKLGFKWTCPDISEGGDGSDLEEVDFNSFGYFVFKFQRNE